MFMKTIPLFCDVTPPSGRNFSCFLRVAEKCDRRSTYHKDKKSKKK